jgi:hypothetical protein
MRHTNAENLSDAQVARLEARRKALGLTRAALLRKFEEALKKDGCIHTEAAAKMRLDRVLNPRLRRAISEETKVALAVALDWKIAEFESAIGNRVDGLGAESDGRKIRGRVGSQVCQELAHIAQQLQQITQMLQGPLQRSASGRKIRNLNSSRLL